MIRLPARAARAVRRLTPRPRPLDRRGEERAARFLRRRGWRILERNAVAGRFEADLVALDRRGTLVIVEVKTRRRAEPPPEAAVGPRKQTQLSRFAALYLQRHPEHATRAVRFDVLAVVWPDDTRPTFRHHAHAFETRL